jgi:hypothetical protein
VVALWMFFRYGLKSVSEGEAWTSSAWQETDPGRSLNGSMEGFELSTNGGDVCLPDIANSSFSFITFGSLGEAPAEAAFRDKSSELHMYFHSHHLGHIPHSPPMQLIQLVHAQFVQKIQN